MSQSALSASFEYLNYRYTAMRNIFQCMVHASESAIYHVYRHLISMYEDDKFGSKHWQILMFKHIFFAITVI